MHRYQWLAMSRIIVGLTIVVGVLTSCGAASQASSTSGQPSSGLQGTDLGESNAPDFRLFDQHHHLTSLTQFRGMPIVLTFFYTHCPNYCPLIADKIHTALVQLGPAAQKVAILAVSADPGGDTPASVAAFSREHHLQGYLHWHYLLGARQALSPVWAIYHVAGVPPHAQMMSPSAMQHSSVIYLIDQRGRERVLLDSYFLPTQLTKDVELLLANHP